jgi:hypothetical protein
VTHIPPYAPSDKEWMRQVAGQLNPFFERLASLPNYLNDTAAAAGGVNIGELYRNGSQVMVRVS